MNGLDPNAVVMAAVVAVGGIALGRLQRPEKIQDQMMIAAIGALGMYTLRQLEGRGNRQDDQGLTLTAVAEQVKTLFVRIGKTENATEAHDKELSELRGEVRVMVRAVEDVVKRLDDVVEVARQATQRRRP